MSQTTDRQPWTYGEEGEVYPVQPGEVWAAGPHLFACSDLMASRLFDDLVTERATASLLYTDPPWGQSLVNSFRTKAGFERATYRWEALYQRIAEIGHSRGLPVWVEGSKPDSRDGAKIPATIRGSRPPFHAHAWTVKYYGKHPSGLYYAGTSAHPFSLTRSLTGMDDDYTPGEVMRAYGPRGVVLDPCAGRGVTSRQAHDSGWGSINNELSGYRVSAALVRMAKHAGYVPERVA